ncbi:MAG: squalene--hopene cyclase, partial [Pirellulales bacterium]|nr:squalene--hopene cyclase [Pirellulales bacterium]
TDYQGGQYAYMPGQRATYTMTAEALLCRQYLGWPCDHRGIETGVEYLLQNLPHQNKPNIYYWYYGTQVMHHVGGKPWKRWNDKIRVMLTSMQEKQGHEAGSWDPRGRFANQGGRLYMTSLAICTLEVYYRHLPLYRKEVLSDLFADANGP